MNHHFKVSSSNHNDYGLSYPTTYEFDIPSGSSGLIAYKKYTATSIWIQIIEKTSNDFFNGIEAVRFNYTANKAYISVAFDADSNDIYLKIVDVSETQIASYQGITEYYDNRKATVVVSGDDWRGANVTFNLVCNILASKGIWFSPGIITESDGISMSQIGWDSIQNKINAGYLEPVAHSRIHAGVLPYDDYESEIDGSRNDLINNLDLPALNKKGDQEYIYGWIEPGGASNAAIRQQLGISKYLADRSIHSAHNFVDWDYANGLYNRVGYSIRMDNTTNLETLNNNFDLRYNYGEIYHLMLHPGSVDWKVGQYADQHLDYIKGKKDVWYVGFGHLYLYNFTRERAVSKDNYI